MKYRSWIGQAVAALTDGKSSRKKDGHKQRDVQTQAKNEDTRPELKIAEEFASETWKSRLGGPHPPTLENTELTSIEVQEISKAKPEDELNWRLSGYASSDTLPMRADSQASTSSTSRSSLATITEPAHEISLEEHVESKKGSISPRTSTSTSSLPLQNGYQFQNQEENRTPLRPRTKSTSSTIFKQSSKAPVTIILTTPDSDPPIPDLTPSQEFYSHYSPIPSRLSLSKSKSTTYSTTRSFSTPSLNRLSSPHSQHYHHHPPRNTSTTSLPSLQKPRTHDPSRLMPPSEQALDLSRLRKAQEYREIRKYMINFLNTKGHTFPSKLRLRIMQGYGIEEGELDPRTRKLFAASSASEIEFERKNRAGGRSSSEGLSWKGTRKESNAENLAILSQAFQAQIPLVTPHLEAAYLNTIPGRLPPKNTIRTAKQEREMRSLGRALPSSRESGSTRGQARGDSFSKLLRESTSVPEISNSRRRPSTSNSSSHSKFSTKTLPDNRLRPASSSLTSSARSSPAPAQTQRQRSLTPVPMEKQMKIAEQQTRIKRQSILAGAFGAVRDGMSSSSKGSKKARKGEGRGL
ncbi:hypothetical protein VTL71DRAFT_12340 [Oculimacula yallundae]|uniref:LisH domain-containing protein n=1 Tax=Oculimacula yallundae TaxID=86028 RepID=A0ABR4CMC1_9HELO